jgi:hypothetical protein
LSFAFDFNLRRYSKAIGGQFIECFKDYKIQVTEATGVTPTFLVQVNAHPLKLDIRNPSKRT